MLAVERRGQLLSLKLELSRGAVGEVRERFAQRLRLLAHPFGKVALGVEAVEEL